MLDYSLIQEKPSKLAAMAVYAAQMIVKGANESIWNATMTKNSGYKEAQIRGMAIDLLQYVKNVETSALQSVFKKYSSAKFQEVAKLLD